MSGAVAGDASTAAETPLAGGDAIRFWWRGALREVRGVPSTMTLLEWLRGEAHQTGTKEGCAEGDCGACLVVLGQLDAAAPEGVSLRAVNSCIHLLAMIDGKAVLTIEDIEDRSGGLHPVQQAMVDCHGSQCGFCTPGFVMALFDLYENHPAVPERARICHALAGNLCRCTGYRPIIEAAGVAARLPRRAFDRTILRLPLERLAAREPLDYRAPAAVGGGRVHAPATLAGLSGILRAEPGARIVAGGTDIGLWITKLGRQLPQLVHIDRVAELHRLDEASGVLEIGAAVSLTDAWQVLAARVPALAELARRFAAPPVCNAGTLGGNVANGSPIGDGTPPLLVLGVRLLLQHGDATRELPLHEFHTGYQRNVLLPGEFLRAIRVPLPGPTARVACYKVSKRHDQDISALCAAFHVELAGDGSLRHARVAFGGMAATPARAGGCEAALEGGRIDAGTLARARQALAGDFKPLSDLRASAAYRRAVAGRLLERWWQELGGAALPLRLDQVEADA